MVLFSSFDVISVVFSPIYCLFLIVSSIYSILSRLWWLESMDSSAKPDIYYRKGSKYIERVIAKCSTLQTG